MAKLASGKEPVFPQMRTGKITFRHVRNKGPFILREHVDKNGKLFVLKDPATRQDTTYTLQGDKEFDLSNPFNKTVFEGFKNHPVYSEKLLFAELEDTAAKSMDFRRLRRELEENIDALEIKTRAMARLVGLAVDRDAIVVVKDKLCKYVENANNAQHFKSLLDSPTLDERLIFTAAKHFGIVTSTNGTMYYKQVLIGNTIDAAVEWLEKNRDYMGEIVQLVEQRQNAEEDRLK